MDGRHFERRMWGSGLLGIRLIRGAAVAAVWLRLCTGLAWADFGDVTSYTLILAPEAATTHTLFGSAVASLGDVDGDGIGDLAIGAAWDNDGEASAGAVWICFLNRDGSLKRAQRISATSGGFEAGIFNLGGQFGRALAPVGDLDGDGVHDLAVSAPNAITSPIPEAAKGAVWILFLKPDGTVKSSRQFTRSEMALEAWEVPGLSLAQLGDLDGKGAIDLAVGVLDPHILAQTPPIVGNSVRVLLLQPGGSVQGTSSLYTSAEPFSALSVPPNTFAQSLSPVGDIDGDGTTDLAIGCPYFPLPGQIVLIAPPGAVCIAFMNSDGSAKSARLITNPDYPTNPPTPYTRWDLFGAASAWLGDIDGDGHPDLMVGSPFADAQGGILGDQGGAVFLFFLNADGTARAHNKISQAQGLLQGLIHSGDGFGASLSPVGDLNGDHLPELAAGTPQDHEGGTDRGAVWILTLQAGIQLLPGDIIRYILGEIALPGPPSTLFDLNQDGAIDVADLVKLLAAPQPIP